MEYYIDAFRNYVNFQGRATRTQFWMFVLFNFIAGVVLSVIARIIPALVFLGSVYNLAVFLPSIAICARRLHDTDRSGWWQLLALIPVIGAIVVLIFCAMPSTGPNRFDVSCCCGCNDSDNGDAAQK